MKEAIHIRVSHTVLLWARESMAITRNKAVESTGISASRLESLENGTKQPSLEELKAMSHTYKRTIATLLLQSPPQEKPLPKDRRTVNSKDIGKFHEKTILAVRKARALVNSLLELKSEEGISVKQFQYKANLEDSASNIAATLRKEWTLNEISILKNSGNVE